MVAREGSDNDSYDKLYNKTEMGLKYEEGLAIKW